MVAEVASWADRLGIQTSVSLQADGSPEKDSDEEEVACTCSDVSFVFGDAMDVGTGTLYITTRRIVWVCQQPPVSLALRYPQVVMHAISRDTSAFARPCLYLQLDDGSEDMDPPNQDDDEGEEEAEVSAEVRLVPADESKVETVFKALCESAALNPDEEDASGEGDFYFNEDEVMAGLDDATRAAVVAQRLEGGMDLNEGDEAAGVAVEGELDELLGEDPNRFDDDEELGEGDVPTNAAAGRGANGHV